MKLVLNLKLDPSGATTDLPLITVLKTIENCDGDLCQLHRGIVLLYQVFCRTDEIRVENEDDERLCHAFVDSFNALILLPNYTSAHPLFFETVKPALDLLLRMRAGHIFFDIL